jgi:hypothetical protein
MKCKIFRTLALIIILSLLLLVMPATPAVAQTVTLSPTSGTVGTTVNVTGTLFPASTYVYVFFGYFDYIYRAYALVNIYGSFTTSFNVPATATPGTTYVVVRDGPASTDTQLAIASFTVTVREITISPSSGQVGSTVAVSGSGFDPSSSVTIYFDTTVVRTVTTTATGTFSGATFTVPESYKGTHTVKVSSASGDSPGVSFTTSQKVEITTTSGFVGDTVTISGNGFAADSGITLYFDDVSISTATTTTNANGSFTNITFTIPPSSRGSHTIKAQDASANYATTLFTIAGEIAITPTSGTSGTSVTVSGTGFSASTHITIKYNDVPVITSPRTVNTDANGSFTANFDVPGGVAGTYLVAATDLIYGASASFVATVDATISQATSEASPGYIGMELTITGTGFNPNTTVTITYTSEPVVLATVTTDATGAFSVTTTIPPSVGGNHLITVTDGYTTKQFVFVMESQAPSVPALLLPEDDTKVESEASFDWEDVDDPSGVTYTLQIARDADFISIALEKQKLTTSEYVLALTEKLPSTGKAVYYYWRVKAVDGASNESAWSTPSSLYVRFFPSWAKYTLIGIFALLFALVSFWFGMRVGRQAKAAS